VIYYGPTTELNTIGVIMSEDLVKKVYMINEYEMKKIREGANKRGDAEIFKNWTVDCLWCDEGGDFSVPSKSAIEHTHYEDVVNQAIMIKDNKISIPESFDPNCYCGLFKYQKVKKADEVKYYICHHLNAYFWGLYNRKAGDNFDKIKIEVPKGNEIKNLESILIPHEPIIDNPDLNLVSKKGMKMRWGEKLQERYVDKFLYQYWPHVLNPKLTIEILINMHSLDERIRRTAQAFGCSLDDVILSYPSATIKTYEGEKWDVGITHTRGHWKKKN
jgi:hypothetical protein